MNVILMNDEWYIDECNHEWWIIYWWMVYWWMMIDILMNVIFMNEILKNDLLMNVILMNAWFNDIWWMNDEFYILILNDILVTGILMYDILIY
jgi:hypothetical protein